jgi:hypothetical protein
MALMLPSKALLPRFPSLTARLAAAASNSRCPSWRLPNSLRLQQLIDGFGRPTTRHVPNSISTLAMSRMGRSENASGRVTSQGCLRRTGRPDRAASNGTRCRFAACAGASVYADPTGGVLLGVMLFAPTWDANRFYSTTACMTAFSKSPSSSPLELLVCTMRMPTIFSFGSTQKWVPKAPSQP